MSDGRQKHNKYAEFSKAPKLRRQRFVEAKKCRNKQRYYPRSFAERVAQDVGRKRNIELRVYPCPNCNGFHLTSQPKRTP